ncbi:MAG: S-layer homology domain-containing protein [Desulfotomaculaceae bacterium]|nr:S-layer homology domain-containing protein [Desulfotomaculaceae bacterium]
MKFRMIAYLQIALMLFMLCVPSISMSSTLNETSLVLSQASAAVGEIVTASGTAAPNAWVPLKVIDAAQSIVVFDTTKADASGNYSIDFVIPAGAAGTLTVIAGEGSNVATRNLTITGTQPPDTEAPVWVGGSLTASNIGQATLTLSWSGASDNVGVTSYNIYQNETLLTNWSVNCIYTFIGGGGSGSGGAPIGNSYIVTGLSPGTQYTFTVQAVDAAGNESKDGPSATVTTLEPQTVTLNLSKAEAAVGETVTASGTAAPNAWVPIKVIDAAQSIVIFDTTKADTIGNYSIDFIVPAGATGTLTVIAGEGSNVATRNLTITGTQPPDTEAPVWVDGSLTFSNVGQNTLTLSWSGASDNVGVTGYKVYQDGVLLTETPATGTSYGVTGLSADTEYTFKVEAGDAVGNWSTDGPSVTVNTVPDYTPIIVEYIVNINGNEVQTDAPFVELNSIVMGSVRCVVTSLGIPEEQVVWNEAKQQLMLMLLDKTLVLSLNSTCGTLNGSQVSLPVPPILYNDRTMVPLQFVVEAFGGTIEIIKTVAAPTVFPCGGAAVVAGVTQLTLTNTTSGATIHYTLDGSTPTMSSPAYNGPITISEAVMLKAIAVKAGLSDSDLLIASYTIAEPIVEPEVTVKPDGSNKELSITQDTLNLSEPVQINVPSDVKDATISVTELMNEPDPDTGTVSTGSLPALNIDASTDLSATAPVKLEIPAGASISAPAGWNGTINVPRVQENSSVQVTPDEGMTATVDSVIEVGFGDVPLTFTKAVRILIPDRAGKDAGYFRDNQFYKINSLTPGALDTQEWADNNLPGGGDGKLDVGDDLVIWTKHFTRFATYTQTKKSTGGGGGSSPQAVISTTGKATVKPSVGGTISLGDEATIKVPANALTGTGAVEVKVQKLSMPPVVPAGFKLAGSVYEFSVGGENSCKFARDVTIILSFDPEVLGPEDIPAIHYYDETLSQWINIGGTVSGNTITVQVDHLTKFAVMVADEQEEQPILNDIAGHWAADSINQLVAAGTINGFPDGSFKPEKNITRAEFATILVKAFELAYQDGRTFTDTAAHWAGDYIAAAADNGVVNGYETGAFGPDDLITREQIAVMVVKAAKLSASAGELRFADSSDISGWAREAIVTATQNGVMKGYPDNTIQPQGNATRAEAVTVIVNALNSR